MATNGHLGKLISLLFCWTLRLENDTSTSEKSISAVFCKLNHRWCLFQCIFDWYNLPHMDCVQGEADTNCVRKEISISMATNGPFW